MVSSTTKRSATEAIGINADATVTDMKRTSSPARGKRAPRSKNKEHVADALRSVYQRAVNEDIPAEMLDLLSKLD
ncbi:MAG: NepR family anti-sigma factor [Sphingobium sp.]